MQKRIPLNTTYGGVLNNVPIKHTERTRHGMPILACVNVGLTHFSSSWKIWEDALQQSTLLNGLINLKGIFQKIVFGLMQQARLTIDGQTPLLNSMENVKLLLNGRDKQE